jgi:hypothetical protein
MHSLQGAATLPDQAGTRHRLHAGVLCSTACICLTIQESEAPIKYTVACIADRGRASSPSGLQALSAPPPARGRTAPRSATSWPRPRSSSGECDQGMHAMRCMVVRNRLGKEG